MSEETRDEVLTLSSVAMGIWFIAFTAAFGCLFASLPFFRFFFAWLEPHNTALQQPVPLEAILCCLVLGLSIGAVGPLMLYCSCCGTWRINTDGTEFRHLFMKRRQYLRWEDVDQIHWSHLQFGLKGKDIRLIAYWHWFPKPTQDQARGRLQRFFLRAFDLPAPMVPTRRWSFEPTFSSVAAWTLKMAGVAIVITATAMGTIFCVAVWTDWDSLFGKTVRILLPAIFIVLILLPLLLYSMSAEAKRIKELNPYWRSRRNL